MRIKGAKEYKAFIEGKKLTRKQAIFANCFICNGLEEGTEDCLGEKSCPIYQVSHFNRSKKP